ncbi:MAG: O-antigen ligase family protein, partial [Acholeplasmatales bacterium]|nr:O-antigen ligase family protein [Acholeplasmatales bacterium]
MNTFLQGGKRFIESKYCILVLSFVAILAFLTDVSYIALYTACLTVIAVIIFKADLRCILGIFLLGLASHRNVDTSFNAGMLIFIIFVLLMIASIIYYIVINHKIVWTKIKKDYVLWSLVLISLSMCLSLINTPAMGDSLLGLSYFVGMVVAYFIARIMIERTEEVKEYIAYSFVIVGITLALEVFGAMMFNYINDLDAMEIIKIKALSIGMFNQNHIMAAINTCFIMSIYYFIINKKIIARILFLINAFLFLATNLMLACRGGMVGLLVCVPLVIVAYIIYYKKNPGSGLKKDLPYLIAGAVGIVAVVLTLVFTGYVKNAFDRFNDTEAIFAKRDEVFKIGWEQFLAHPIIGSGVYSSHYYLIDIDRVNRIWHYHNHMLQMLGTCGIIGGISFTLYLVFSIKRTLNCNLYSMIAFILTIYFLVHGALD